jgi:cardiolipin synthase
MPRWLNIANLFTLARLVAVPFAVQAILAEEHRRALGLVLAAGATDAIDGAIARRFGMMTAAGAYLDPIVDKLFLSAVYIALAAVSAVPWWLVIVIFTRDVMILASSGALLMLHRMHRFPPSVWGKASTFLQIVLALFIVLRNAAAGITPQEVPDPIIWGVAALTAFSGIHYIWRGIRELQSGPRAAIDGGLARE